LTWIKALLRSSSIIAAIGTRSGNGEEKPMAYKDLLVVLDEDQRSRDRLVLAAVLAQRYGAHLVGLYVTVGREPPGRLDYFNSDMPLLGPLYRDVEEKIRADAERTRLLFEEIVGRQSLSAEWRMASGNPAALAAMHGRYADLIVLGQLDPEDPRALVIRPLPEEVALLVGRPILVVPYAGTFEQIGQRVLVAWDASREATRAVNDAMPLLAGASSVIVISVDSQESRDGHGEVPGADIALHLARHGVTAQVERTASAGIGVGNTLLSRACDLEADLLVMGAYGHSRVRELLLGGATRTVLVSMTLPVLMAH
jgi:nucleotide-binding universal stress UspA family protein